MMNKEIMFSQKMINLIMDRNYECLDDLGDLEYKEIFDADESAFEHLDLLLKQIICDQDHYNFRSAFRKAVLLKGMLSRISQVG